MNALALLSRSVLGGLPSVLIVTACSGGGSGGPREAPLAPSGLRAEATSSSSVDLRWFDHSSNESEFELHRSLDGERFDVIATLGRDQVSFSDRGLTSETAYTYRVRARNAQGASAFSNLASVLTPAPGSAKIVGAPGVDSARAIVATDDGGSIAVGVTDSFGAGMTDAWVIRLDREGRILWQNTYGGSNSDSADSIAATRGGNFVVAGSTESFGAGAQDAWVFEIDPDGRIVWERTYGSINADFAGSVVEAPNTDLIVVGSLHSGGMAGFDAWVLRLDADGNVVWETAFQTGGDEFLGDVIALTGGRFAVVGSLVPPFGIMQSMLAMEIDDFGNLVWDAVYDGDMLDGGASVAEAADGGLYLQGTTSSFGTGTSHPWVLKVRRDGSIDWQFLYRAPGGASFGLLSGGIRDEDDNVVLACTVGLSVSQDGWIVSLRNDGLVNWAKLYSETAVSWFHDLHQTESGYRAVGTRASGADIGDVWVVSLGPRGNVDFAEGSEIRAVDFRPTAVETDVSPLAVGPTVYSTSSTHGHSSATVQSTSATVQCQ